MIRYDLVYIPAIEYNDWTARLWGLSKSGIELVLFFDPVLDSDVPLLPVLPVVFQSSFSGVKQMGTVWYFTQGGHQKGPVEFSELQQMGTGGTIQPHDLVWSEGMPQWVSAAMLPDLLPTASTAPIGAAPPTGAAVPLAYYAGPVAQVTYAGFWLRFVAALVDGLLLLVILLGVGFFLAFVTFELGLRNSTGGTDNPVVNLMNSVINIAVIWFYFAKQESSPKRSTPGKNMLGLQVTDMHSQRITFGRATGRFFGKYISGFILFIGFVMAGFTERRQALHDIMAGCLVIKSGKMKVV